MQRREFLTAAAGAVGAAVAAGTVAMAAAEGGGGGGAAQASDGDRQLIEIRTYHFASPEKQKAYEEFLARCGIAAMNRAGARPAGVFRMLAADNPKLKMTADSTDLWVILPHDSAEAFLSFERGLAEDKEYQEEGKDVLLSSKEYPAFDRYESMLLHAFEGMPRVVAPKLSDGRVLELRTYMSRNQERAASKVHMFNSGEIPIFSRSGMPPVFFGSAVAGSDLPQLTYMISHETLESAKDHWKAFGSDPDWKKLREMPEYKDNVSKIIDRFLRPSPGSQI